MKLSRIYSNQTRLFAPIAFNGVRDANISVVFARITKPKDPTKDSHNLGKTTLVHLIDFLLLKNIEKEHIFLKHAELFAKFVFYLQLQTPKGDYVTVRRGVATQTRASLKRHAQEIPDLSDRANEKWDHEDITIDKARQLLDSYLDLGAIKPWDYRKGVSYFLRAQADYRDYFQIEKFVKGRDVEWKPYLSQIVGLDSSVVEKKYVLDDDIAALEQRRDERQAEVQFSEEDYTKLQARIAIRQQEVERTGQLLDKFDFRHEEERINKTLVQRVESRTAEINSALYDTDYDLEELRSALKTGFAFKLETVRQVFEETRTYVPEKLLKDYESLVDFNKKLTQERNSLIRRQIRELEVSREQLSKEAQGLNQERVRLMELLGDEDTFKKFKGLQKAHAAHQGELRYLVAQQESLEKVIEISRQIRELQRERDEAAAKLKDTVQRPSDRTKTIQIEFNDLVHRVLDLTGEFYLAINQSANVEFKVETKLPGSRRETSSQSEGTSYKKVLCALFDLAILRTYSKEPFYHFVYHDGILEGLDVRKRKLVLEVLRETATKFGIQCIISVIDSDLPRTEDDAKIPFPQSEIIVDLSDSGPTGRLFRMREF
jgi:uncharacterized protein YydD (DUF2326 family)